MTIRPNNKQNRLLLLLYIFLFSHANFVKKFQVITSREKNLLFQTLDRPLDFIIFVNRRLVKGRDTIPPPHSTTLSPKYSSIHRIE